MIIIIDIINILNNKKKKKMILNFLFLLECVQTCINGSVNLIEIQDLTIHPSLRVSILAGTPPSVNSSSSSLVDIIRFDPLRISSLASQFRERFPHPCKYIVSCPTNVGLFLSSVQISTTNLT